MGQCSRAPTCTLRTRAAAETRRTRVISFIVQLHLYAERSCLVEAKVELHSRRPCRNYTVQLTLPLLLHTHTYTHLHLCKLSSRYNTVCCVGLPLALHHIIAASTSPLLCLMDFNAEIVRLNEKALLTCTTPAEASARHNVGHGFPWDVLYTV